MEGWWFGLVFQPQDFKGHLSRRVKEGRRSRSHQRINTRMANEENNRGVGMAETKSHRVEPRIKADPQTRMQSNVVKKSGANVLQHDGIKTYRKCLLGFIDLRTLVNLKVNRHVKQGESDEEVWIHIREQLNGAELLLAWTGNRHVVYVQLSCVPHASLQHKVWLLFCPA